MTSRPLPRIARLLALLALPACTSLTSPGGASPAFPVSSLSQKVTLTEGEWEARLDEAQYEVMREWQTERAFSGSYWNHWGHGTYQCAACGQHLYHSDDKFESGTGWPSFSRGVEPRAIDTAIDRSLGMVRTALVCSRCGSHLGHVYDDGPTPTGLRHSINSAALQFVPAPEPRRYAAR